MSVVRRLGAIGALPQREAGDELVLELHIRLDYPDARDAGELVSEDGRPPRVVARAATVAVQAEAAAEAGEARGKRLAGGASILPRGGVAHPLLLRKVERRS